MDMTREEQMIDALARLMAQQRDLIIMERGEPGNVTADWVAVNYEGYKKDYKSAYEMREKAKRWYERWKLLQEWSAATGRE
jgi:hypothetical protein